MVFIEWCGLNHLKLNVSKTKEQVVEPTLTPASIHGEDVEIFPSYKYLGVHLDDGLGRTKNTEALYFLQKL